MPTAQLDGIDLRFERAGRIELSRPKATKAAPEAPAEAAEVG